MVKHGRTWRIRKRNSKKSCTNSTEPDSSDIVLLKWMKSNAFKNRCLKSHIFPGIGRGLMATQALHHGDIIVSLPKNLMITTETALKSYLGNFVKRSPQKLSPVQVICLYLIAERHFGEKSFWYPYIQVLPKTFSNPLFFTSEDLELLPVRLKPLVCSLVDKVKMEFTGISQCVKDIEQHFTDFRGIFTYESFRWAWCVVNTRCVYLRSPQSPYLSSDEDHYALAPFLDLLNHSCCAQVSAGFNANTDCYEIVTFTPYKRHDQVFINYGPHDNNTLLLEYGFTLPLNEHNVVCFTSADLEKACLESGVSDLKRKLKFIEDSNFYRDLSCSFNGLSWNLKTSLQILCTNSHDLKQWKAFVSGAGGDYDHKMVCCILKKLLDEATSWLPCQQLVKTIDSPHKGLILTLIQDISNIINFVSRSSCWEVL